MRQAMTTPIAEVDEAVIPHLSSRRHPSRRSDISTRLVSTFFGVRVFKK